MTQAVNDREVMWVEAKNMAKDREEDSASSGGQYHLGPNKFNPIALGRKVEGLQDYVYLTVLTLKTQM